eukprot:scaffold99813_cov51-Phaeocystis_antarctica.AAC.2
MSKTAAVGLQPSSNPAPPRRCQPSSNPAPPRRAEAACLGMSCLAGHTGRVLHTGGAFFPHRPCLARRRRARQLHAGWLRDARDGLGALPSYHP